MSVQMMSDIAPDDARGADLFLYGRTRDPRGLHLLSSVGLTAPRRLEIRQTEGGVSDADKASDASDFDIGVDQLATALTKWIETHPGIPHIVIDISCMSRPTMASAFQAMLEASESKSVRLDVLYVLAEYTPPPAQLPPNEDIRPINDWFAGWPTNATASTSLVVGLGYERDKASGACEYFDASENWVFVPQSAISDYQTAVEHNNDVLLARARRRELATTYRVERPTETFGLLASTVSRILPRANPVLLPFGPKVFFALNLLVASIYREAGVWHVTGDSELPDVPHAPSSITPAFRVELGPSVSPIASDTGSTSAVPDRRKRERQADPSRDGGADLPSANSTTSSAG